MRFPRFWAVAVVTRCLILLSGILVFVISAAPNLGCDKYSHSIDVLTGLLNEETRVFDNMCQGWQSHFRTVLYK